MQPRLGPRGTLGKKSTEEKLIAPYHSSELRTSCVYRTILDQVTSVVPGVVSIDVLVKAGECFYDAVDKPHTNNT